MDYKIMRKWVKALRSGKYKQGHGRLKDRNRYCCLGVLCCITKSKKYSSYLTLPKFVMDKTKMKTSDGKYEAFAKPLTDLNDVYNFSFKKIANVIEKNWRKL